MLMGSSRRAGSLRFLICLWLCGSGIPWLAAAARAADAEAVIRVDAGRPGHRISRLLTGACLEDVNHEIYGGLYSQMIFGESFQEPPPPTPPEGFAAFGGSWSVADGEISGMWRAFRSGTATGVCAVERDRPFVGAQSQRLTHTGGRGAFGVENQGLNRWGLHVVGGKDYEGVLWARADERTEVWVALESSDGSTIHAEQALRLEAGDWQRLAFTLTPGATEARGRFAVKLRAPGSVALGYAFLQPGAWGRFKGLPVRRDVAEALIDQGLTVLRYGGSMINHAEYRWKNMIGPRERRPPHRGTWYPHSSNGWGILDFMEFCEAAGFECIPAFNIHETPQDLADFMEYATGGADTAWGARRAADGHPPPYRLRYLELGNEERVDERYADLFEPRAKAIWARDTTVTLVVGDFVYGQPIADPARVRGAHSGITNLAGQKRILELAREYRREVWFDVHVGTDGPRPDATFGGMLSFRDALEDLAAGARHRVAVFEFNAQNHTHRRALANALAIQALERDGRIPIACSANCLQPDGQNDNGWDQGLLFLNPARVWLQPPGWVTRMVSRHYQPVHVPAVVEGTGELDVSAKRSEDGRTLVLQVVNSAGRPVAARIAVSGFAPAQPTADVEELAGPLEARNTAADPRRLTPQSYAWPHGMANGEMRRTFPAHSFSVLVFR